jgi:CheY-like chemotaxis protein
MSRRVVAVVNNLFFVGKIEAAARQIEVDLEFATSPGDLLEKVRAGAELVVFDLGDASTGALAALKELKSRPETADVPTLGFLRHTQPDIAAQAREAGCETVLARSEFSARIVELLRGDRRLT